MSEECTFVVSIPLFDMESLIPNQMVYTRTSFNIHTKNGITSNGQPFVFRYVCGYFNTCYQFSLLLSSSIAKLLRKKTYFLFAFNFLSAYEIDNSKCNGLNIKKNKTVRMLASCNVNFWSLLLSAKWLAGTSL